MKGHSKGRLLLGCHDGLGAALMTEHRAARECCYIPLQAFGASCFHHLLSGLSRTGPPAGPDALSEFGGTSVKAAEAM